MTCEVAVMNKFGVALAADSAVTLGSGEKIYHHARKLFELNQNLPVGIMVYGSAEIMGMPWEIVIKQYTLSLGEKRFDRLEQYAQDFFQFTENAKVLFLEQTQQDWFQDTVEHYWRGQIVQPLAHELKRLGRCSPKKQAALFSDILNKEIKSWEKHPRLHKSDDPHGELVLTTYAPVIEKLEGQIFRPVTLTEELHHKLRLTVKHMYSRDWCTPDTHSGIVFAGMGEAEPFATIQQYNIGAVAAGVLHWHLREAASISRQDSAIVVPLAQTDMIDMFYRGIDEDLDEKLDAIVARSIADEFGERSNKCSRSSLENVKRRFRKMLNNEIDNKYEAPLIAAVGGLPRHDLARMAEALINLTALRRRMTVNQRETVGGQIDVAILAKGDGFRWVKSGGLANC